MSISIHYELSGNPRGLPVLVLHGGPGGGSYPSLRRYFDPARWLIVLHDHRGVFTCTRAEVDRFYHGGVEPYFPDAYAALRAAVPHPERKDWPRQLLALTTSTDAATRDRAVRAWALYETRISKVGMTQDEAEQELAEDWDKLSFSRIENHYMANRCFLEEGQLLRDLPRIADVPTVIAQGRYDVICPPITAWKVSRGLREARLVMIEDAGHSGGAPPMRRALVEAVRSLEPVAEAARVGAGTASPAPGR